MNARVTTKTVVFSRAFTLNEADGEQPPGVYTVETEGAGNAPIDASELEAAIARDAMPRDTDVDTTTSVSHE